MKEYKEEETSEFDRLIEEAFEKDESEGVIKHLNEIVDIYPDNDDAYYYRSYLYFSFEEYDKAFLDIKKAIEIDPKNSLYFRNRAYCKYFLGDIEGANIDFAKATCLNKDSLRSDCFGWLKDIDIEDYNALIESGENKANLYLERAVLNYNLGEFDLAYNDLNKAIELDSSCVFAYYNRAIVSIKMEDNEKAIEDFTKVIELDPTNINAYMNRGILTSSISDMDEAIALYPYHSFAYKKRGELKQHYKSTKEGIAAGLGKKDDLEESKENKTSAQLVRSFIEFLKKDNGNFEAGCRDVNYSLNLEKFYPADVSDLKEPTSSYDYQKIAFIKYKIGELEEALKYYNEAVRLDDANAEAISYRARVSQEMGDKTENLQHYEDALRDFNEGMRLGFSGCDMFYYRRALKEVLGNLNRAMQDYEEALSLDSDHEEAIQDQFYLQMKLGDYSEIKPVIISLDPKTSKEYTNNAKAKINSKNYKGALEDLNKAIDLDSNNSDAYFNRYVVNDKLNRKNEALSDIDKVIELGFVSVDIYLSSSTLRHELRDIDGALEDIEKAIKLKPDNAAAYYNRGLFKACKDNYKEALVDFVKSIELDPNDPSTYFNRGLIHIRLNNNQEGLANFDKVIELDSGNARAYFQRAFLRANAGIFDGALEDINKSISMGGSNNADAYRVRASVYRNLSEKEEDLEQRKKYIELAEIDEAKVESLGG